MNNEGFEIAETRKTDKGWIRICLSGNTETDLALLKEKAEEARKEIQDLLD